MNDDFRFKLLECSVIKQVLHWHHTLSHREIVDIRHNAMAMPMFKLINVCKPEWTVSEAIMCLGRLIAHVEPNGKLSFLTEMGKISHRRNVSSMPINQSRFQRILGTGTWDDFYKSFLECMKIIDAYSRCMRELSIIEIASIVYSRSEFIRITNSNDCTQEEREIMVLKQFNLMLAEPFFKAAIREAQ